MSRKPVSRRAVLGGLAASLALATSARALEEPGVDENPEDWIVGEIPDRPFNVPVVDLDRIDPAYHRQLVPYRGPERPGTLVVDTANRFLYLVRGDGTALRYGIGVGRTGFAWSGVAQVRRRAAWPTWRPPAEMRRRRPDLPAVMEGGLDNPLGARALYLYQGDRDTLYRIHGTNEPWSIGEAVSSGCIRLLNQDIYDLYHRVALGSTVIVRAHDGRRRLTPPGGGYDIPRYAPPGYGGPWFEAEEPLWEGPFW
jgi:lipoprotein-anchoring transpeptidase ErfK/SrfK